MNTSKAIIYKSDNAGMWWAEVQNPATGKWWHVCELTHTEAIDALGILLQEAQQETPSA